MAAQSIFKTALTNVQSMFSTLTEESTLSMFQQRRQSVFAGSSLVVIEFQWIYCKKLEAVKLKGNKELSIFDRNSKADSMRSIVFSKYSRYFLRLIGFSALMPKYFDCRSNKQPKCKLTTKKNEWTVRFLIFNRFRKTILLEKIRQLQTRALYGMIAKALLLGQ